VRREETKWEGELPTTERAEELALDSILG